MRSSDYLDRIRAQQDLPSDYAVAKLLGVSQQRVQRYRVGKSEFGDDIAMQVAELLKLNPLKVIADVRAASAKDRDVRKIWERLADQASRLAPSVGAAMLTASLVGGTLPSPAQASQAVDLTKYTLCEVRRRRLFAIKAILAELQAVYQTLGVRPGIPIVRAPGDRRGFQHPISGGRRSYDQHAA